MSDLNILGVSAHFHDSAVCLLRGGQISAAAQEEWFTRNKHDSSYPASAADWCLQSQGLGWRDIDWFAFYELPLLKKRRIADSAKASGDKRPFRAIALAQLRKDRTSWDVGALFPRGRRGSRVFAVEHHMSHAAAAFFPSPFEDAAIVTTDGAGEYTTTSISRGTANRITPLLRQSFPHSLGLLYSAFTYYCGFKVNSGEYKLMGLAPYGRPRYAPFIEQNVINIADDGAFRLNLDYFSFVDPASDYLINRRLGELLGRGARTADAKIDEFYADVAASAQAVFEKVAVRTARHALRATGAKKLCLAGGGALNCVANSKILEQSGADDVWVQPAAGDAGSAVGAAFFVWFQRLNRPRETGMDAMRGARLGPEFSNLTIARFLDSVGAHYERLSEDEMVRRTAGHLAEGKVVAWFQGRQEFGPRALGSRSILADPRDPGMRRRLNLTVKNREEFRPFAPAVVMDMVDHYFGYARPSPYMLFVAPVSAALRQGRSAGPSHEASGEAFGAIRSMLPAITHVDYSARLQTVDEATDPLFWRLINEFGRLTGVHVLINTSFNVRGEPIVCTPEDTLRTFMGADIDLLCIGDCLLERHRQKHLDVTINPITELD